MKKLPIVAFILPLCLCFSCSSKEESGECLEHAFDAGTIIKEADCGNPGLKELKCQKCGATKTEVYAEATGSHSMKDGVCSTCGYIDMSEEEETEAIEKHGYYHCDIDKSKTISSGDKLYLGSYPSKLVSESDSLKAALNESGWTSYGYSVKNTKSDIASYQDITVNSKKYRAVKIDGYRPYFTDLDSDSTFVSSNGYAIGTYYFEYSPIEWRVMDNVNKEITLHSVDILDGQSFADSYGEKDGSEWMNASGSAFANDYESSYIRSFLNGSFYNAAFSDSEKALIKDTTLDNATTSYSTSNDYASSQKSTTDKVYLLSYQDMLNARYKLPSDVVSTSAQMIADGDCSVCKNGSDYAKAQGLRDSQQVKNSKGNPCSWWMLRSAGGKSYSMCGVTKYGTLAKSNSGSYKAEQKSESDGIAFYTAEGIAPAITITLGK